MPGAMTPVRWWQSRRNLRNWMGNDETSSSGLLVALAIMATASHASQPFNGRHDVPFVAPPPPPPPPRATRPLLLLLKRVCDLGLIFEPVILADYLPFALRTSFYEDPVVLRADKAPTPLGMTATYERKLWEAQPSITLAWPASPLVSIPSYDVYAAIGMPDDVEAFGARDSGGGRFEIYEQICKSNSRLLVVFGRDSDDDTGCSNTRATAAEAGSLRSAQACPRSRRGEASSPRCTPARSRSSRRPPGWGTRRRP